MHTDPATFVCVVWLCIFEGGVGRPRIDCGTFTILTPRTKRSDLFGLDYVRSLFSVFDLTTRLVGLTFRDEGEAIQDLKGGVGITVLGSSPPSTWWVDNR